jgi:hypothetical protein
VIGLRSAFTPQTSLAAFEDLYLVMELMDHSLQGKGQRQEMHDGL